MIGSIAFAVAAVAMTGLLALDAVRCRMGVEAFGPERPIHSLAVISLAAVAVIAVVVGLLGMAGAR